MTLSQNEPRPYPRPQSDGDAAGRRWHEGRPGDSVLLTRDVHDAANPQGAEDVDLLVQARASVGELHAQRLVLDRVASRADAPKPLSNV
jgi:hypothetical protein